MAQEGRGVCARQGKQSIERAGWEGKCLYRRERWPGGRMDERKMCNVCVSQERLPLSQAPCVWQGVDSPKGQQQKKGAGHWKSLELFSAHKLPLFVTACFISGEG